MKTKFIIFLCLFVSLASFSQTRGNSAPQSFKIESRKPKEAKQPVQSTEKVKTPKTAKVSKTITITKASTAPVVKPTAEILSPKTGSVYMTSTIRLRYKATAAPGLKYTPKFSVNGKEAQPIQTNQKQADKSKGAIIEQGIEVELPMSHDQNGETVISLQVVDENKNWSEPQHIYLKYIEEKPKPTLHIFAVGISDYPAADLHNLNYAAKDAQDFVQTIKSSDLSMYKEVKSTLIQNKDAKAPYLRSQLTELSKRALQDDVVMLYFSGHGVNHNNERYFLTYDASEEEYYNSLEFDFIKKRMLDMVAKHCRVIVFMDACHSGAMFGINKGNTKEITFATPGVIGFYSSTANEQSAELDKLQNGVFTHVLLDGLKGKAVNKEGQITITQLGVYIQKNVSQQTKGNQTPIIENAVGDAVLFHIKKK